MEKEKYKILLDELASVLRQKNETILMQSHEIAALKEKLEEVEKSAIAAAAKPFFKDIETR